MEKVNKKEIRLVYNLNNENDRKQYDFYTENTQPGKVIKKILSQHMENETENSNVESNGFNNELLKVLTKLNEKIDNLTITQANRNTKTEEVEEIEIKEISLTREVTTDDLDDIDF